MRISNLLRIRTTVYEKGQARLVPTMTMATAACKYRARNAAKIYIHIFIEMYTLHCTYIPYREMILRSSSDDCAHHSLGDDPFILIMWL